MRIQQESENGMIDCGGSVVSGAVSISDIRDYFFAYFIVHSRVPMDLRHRH